MWARALAAARIVVPGAARRTPVGASPSSAAAWRQARRGGPQLAPGDGGDVLRDVPRVLPVEQAGRHLALTARAAVLDGVEHEGGLEVAAVERVEVRPDAADGVGAGERVAGGAVAREQVAPVGLRDGEVDAADALGGVVVAVADRHD